MSDKGRMSSFDDFPEPLQQAFWDLPQTREFFQFPVVAFPCSFHAEKYSKELAQEIFFYERIIAVPELPKLKAMIRERHLEFKRVVYDEFGVVPTFYMLHNSTMADIFQLEEGKDNVFTVRAGALLARLSNQCVEAPAGASLELDIRPVAGLEETGLSYFICVVPKQILGL